MTEILSVLRPSALRPALVGFAAMLALPAVPAAAQQEGIDRLAAALDLPGIIAVMRDEGISSGVELAAGLSATAPPEAWTEELRRIYDAGRMEGEFRANFAAALEGVDIGPIAEFFETEPGRGFIALELAARRALLDPEVEEIAREQAAVAMADRTPRFDLIRNYVEANDLIELNVVGAMNANYNYVLGLMEGGGLPAGVTEEQILADVWSQEPQFRQNMTEWLYSYLLMAYAPASDADLEAYIAFSTSPAGRQLNAALFAGFEPMFSRISRDLGRAAARFLATREL